MIKKLTILFLLACLAVQPFVAMPDKAMAEDTDLNLGFEDMMDGWTQYGTVTVETEKVLVVGEYDEITWTIIPHGNMMAVLTPSGDYYSMEELQSVMQLSDASMDYITGIFPEITNVAYIYRDIDLLAGQQISISWNYVATDYDPYNDASLLCAANIDDASKLPIINGYYSDVSILGATVLGTGNYSTDSYGSTGWQTATVKAAFAGTYRLGFVAYNLDDDYLSPYLFVEDMAGTTLLNGENFDPIDPDDNPPPMQPVKALNYDTDLFHEDAADDGSVAETATLTLSNETFAGETGEAITDVTFENTPAGLTPVVTKTGDNTAVLSFTGAALSHENGDDISNFRVTFGNSVFTGGDASAVLGSDTGILGFDFSGPWFTVKFYDADGGLLSTQEVEAGQSATPPTAPEIPGYTFSAWSAPYDEVNGTLNLTALYTANADTPYTVEYYKPADDGPGYVLLETDNLTGTTDSPVEAVVKDFDGLALDEDKSVLKGIVAGDGSLVLAVYYMADETVVDTGDPTGPWGMLLLLSLFAMAASLAFRRAKAPAKG